MMLKNEWIYWNEHKRTLALALPELYSDVLADFYNLWQPTGIWKFNSA